MDFRRLQALWALLILDEGEVALKPFDVVVQRGTNHYWVNHSEEPALFAAVLLDATR